MNETIGRCHDCTAPQTETNMLSRHILELQKDKGELIDKCRVLEDKLANADYQLEGRDLEIKELKEENLKLEAKVKALEIEQHYCMPNCSKVTELEKQIEELKSIEDVATLIRSNNSTVVTLLELNNRLVFANQQIEKMKCCNNCCNFEKDEDGLWNCRKGCFSCYCMGKGCKEWELAEN